MAEDGDQAALRKANRRLVWQLSAFALGSLAFGFALIPLYDVMCEVTGYGSRRNLTEASTIENTSAVAREVTVEFIVTNPTVGEWELKPTATSIKVRTGQLAQATFVARNLLSRPATAQAVPSLSPNQASRFFRKTECFCFTPQHFDANQTRELSVRFVVDSQLPPNVDRITLGYSMFGTLQRADQVAAR